MVILFVLIEQGKDDELSVSGQYLGAVSGQYLGTHNLIQIGLVQFYIDYLVVIKDLFVLN